MSKWEKFKETLGIIYVIVAIYVGVYYLMKWMTMGIFLGVDWISNKITAHKEAKVQKKVDEAKAVVSGAVDTLIQKIKEYEDKD